MQFPTLNILFLISDQHKRSALGHEGHPRVLTPHLDELAANGVRCTAAYCASPLCAPSRGSLMHGAYPHRTGTLYHVNRIGGEAVPSGFHRFPGYREDFKPMGELFRDAGYATAALGKMHVHGETRDNRLGFEENALRFYTFAYEDYEERVGRGDPDLGRRKRFQYTARSEEGQPYDYSWTGQYNNLDSERCPAVIETMKDSVMTEEDMIDVLTTRECLDYLERKQDQPFLLHVGLEKPHPPWTEIERHMDCYDWREIPDEELPLHFDEELRPFLPDWVMGTPAKEDIKRALAGYYANVTSMDEKVGQIIGKLRELGIEDRTLVVYCSDHGEMAYEHAQIEKHCMYEAAVNVPLIFSCPGRLPSGRVVNSPVSLIDLLPTLCDFCGIPPAPQFQGRSLLPLLEGSVDDVIDRAVYSEIYEGEYRHHPQSPGKRVAMRMIRTPEYKYIYTDDLPDQLYPVGSEELFSRDNLAGSHPEVVRKLKRCVLAGWHSEGRMKSWCEEPDVEDLLEDKHLRLSRKGDHLHWTAAERIRTWDNPRQELVLRPVESFVIFGAAEEEMYGARELFRTSETNVHLPPNLGSESRYLWVVAESEGETLAASNAVLTNG